MLNWKVFIFLKELDNNILLYIENNKELLKKMFDKNEKNI